MSEDVSVDAVSEDSIESGYLEESDDGGLQEDIGEESEGMDVQAENVEELQEELEEAAANGATEEELKSMVEEFELKVNGKTLTKKLDLMDKEAVKRELQKAYAGQLAMQDKAELEKALKSKVDEWKSNPWAFFEQMGMDPDEIAELRMAQRLEEMKKDPAELEREKMQKELEQARQLLKEKEEREKELEYQRMQEEAAMQLDNEISEALDAHPTLPASPRVIRQIADTLAWAITPSDQGGGGFEPDEIHVKDVLPTVEKEIKKEISDLMAALPEEMLEQYIGNKGLEKLKKKTIAKAKKAPKSAKSLKKPSAPKVEPKKEEKKKGRLEDFFSVRNR
jgi:hypothetical protein